MRVVLDANVFISAAISKGPSHRIVQAERYVATLAAAADVVSDPATGPALTHDQDDDYVIYLARAHHADFVVSGDADLLEWHEQDLPVVSPAEFETRLNQI